jgi:hypothetical protein
VISPKPTGATNAEVIALLNRHGCPTPFHEVRARFMGNIASPVMAASPLDAVKQLWGGELPEFDSMDAVNDLLNVLVGGLWNRLTEHQSSRNPFRLIRFDVEPIREGLKHLALVRRQELDGFVDGLFGAAESLDLPERAHRALGVLAELRAFLAGTIDLLGDSSKPASESDLRDLLRNLHKMSLIAESELNQIILSCIRARRQFFAHQRAVKPTWH